ncbi:LysR substrate-binding domain-containing protein (plasmid) [Paraburkholderia strydomiana]
MSIREIEAFRAVMASGTTSKAASLLGVSQPAISQSIRKLEELAGLRLFDRVRGRLQPTQEAHALMSEVNRYYVGYEAIEHRIRSLRIFGLGRLSLASYPAFGNCFVGRAIAAFEPQRRNMQMRLNVTGSKDVYQQVVTGQVDFGLMNDEVNTQGVEQSAFCMMPGVIAMAADHPLSRKAVLDLKDLASDHYIDMNPEDSARRRLDIALTEEKVKLRAVVETPLSVTACQLALRRRRARAGASHGRARLCVARARHPAPVDADRMPDLARHATGTLVIRKRQGVPEVPAASTTTGNDADRYSPGSVPRWAVNRRLVVGAADERDRFEIRVHVPFGEIGEAEVRLPDPGQTWLAFVGRLLASD